MESKTKSWRHRTFGTLRLSCRGGGRGRGEDEGGEGSGRGEWIQPMVEAAV